MVAYITKMLGVIEFTLLDIAATEPADNFSAYKKGLCHDDMAFFIERIISFMDDQIKNKTTEQDLQMMAGMVAWAIVNQMRKELRNFL